MNVCCAGLHPFDERRVADVWWPSPLRFLVIGETPSPDSPYFYDPMPEGRRDPVRVRRNLLGGLAQRGLVSTPILAAFKGAGFLFDHAIRCRLSKPETKKEWRRARRFASDRAHQAHHLGRALGESGKVWIMGWLALDAVTHLTALPRQAVAAGVIPARPLEGKFFVSRYLLHASQAEMDAILDGFRAFVAV